MRSSSTGYRRVAAAVAGCVADGTPVQEQAAVSGLRDDHGVVDQPPILQPAGWTDGLGRQLMSLCCSCDRCGAISDEVVLDESSLYRWLFDGGPIQAAFPELAPAALGIVSGRFSAETWLCSSCAG